MVAEIEHNIQEVTAESNSANQALTHLDDWGDTDLDQANIQKQRFEGLASRLRELNLDTIRAFNNNQNEVYGLLTVMKALLQACERNIASLNKSKIAKAIPSTIEDFQEEVDLLRENIDDFVLIHDQLPADSEWQNVLSQL